jgi:arabinose-5-phosphate isomerase
MVMLRERAFTAKDFARYHPAGSLGMSLLLRVDDIMRSGQRFAHANADVSVQQALLLITEARCGCIALTDADGRLCGVFSDGDFRRASLRHPDVLQRPVNAFMSTSPKTVRSGLLAVEALKVFERSSVNDLVVVDAANRPVGLIDGQDMPRLRVL